MDKLLLMSVVLATAIIPAIAAREPKPRRALRRTVLTMVVFNAMYAVLVMVVYPLICWN
jgi:hypothetical protein